MAKRPPPTLPPRQNSVLTLSTFEDEDEEAPPPYDSIPIGDASQNGPWTSRDSRSSSTQSLVPSESNQQNERRKLLLIFIHGFMGNETSFRSFPAHVHNLLTILLAESHVVHTKIYPRYRSKRNISFARDDLSKWLEPHEDPKTDVVLLGHSMGGLLAAEVVLMPPPPPANTALKHRILGIINFDVPFLGMHPGVVKSGLASIFSAPEQPTDSYSPGLTPVTSNDGATSSSSNAAPTSPGPRRSDTLWQPNQNDPNFNPSFTNDVVLPMRKGWRNAWHFVNKHSGELTKATKQLVSSHMEFGGAMANYGELKTRYARVRALEEEDAAVRRSVIKDNQTPPRVRFINYYTASTGRLKRVKSPRSEAQSSRQQTAMPGNASADGSKAASLAAPSTLDLNRRETEPESLGADLSSTPSPRISVEEHRNDGDVVNHDDEALADEDWEDAAETLTIHDPRPIESEGEDEAEINVETNGGSDVTSPVTTPALVHVNTLPPIPDLLAPPPPLNVSFIQDADTRKLVEKEHSRAVKAYDKAVKDRQKAVAERAKLQEKRERQEKKDAEKARKDAERSKKDAEGAKRDAEKAAQKAEAERLKQVERQRKDSERELTHSQKEAMRLEKERLRVEAEGRRMRGEKEPEPEPEPEPPAVSEAESAVEDDDTMDDHPDPPEQDLTDEHSPDPAEQRLMAEHSPDPAEQDLSAIASLRSTRSSKPDKPPKDRKFCTLPPKDSNGQRDPCWVRVFMQNVDEVGAHCGLFFVDERYERLVGDVAERIEGWVNEDMGRRMAGLGEKH